MKTVKTILSTCFLIALCFPNIMAQTEESIFIKGKEIFLHKDLDLRLKSFFGRNLAGKIHLVWIISNLKNNGTFVIYRSVDEENYEIIGVKQSMVVSKRKETEYTFTDDNPVNSGISHYKIVFLGINNSFFTSPKITADLSVFGFTDRCFRK